MPVVGRDDGVGDATRTRTCPGALSRDVQRRTVQGTLWRVTPGEAGGHRRPSGASFPYARIPIYSGKIRPARTRANGRTLDEQTRGIQRIEGKMTKTRVSELAHELRCKANDILGALPGLGIKYTGAI